MRRFENTNDARFLTFSCYQRLPLFSHDAIKDAFVDHIDQTRARTRFALLAWVVMPEHVHLLIWPSLPEYPVSRVLWWLKRDFARLVIECWRETDATLLARITAPDGKPHFWQRGGGYDRNIFGGNELNEKLEYIHTNPVRRGLAKRPEDWVWSSARWYAGQREGALRIDPVRRPD